MGQVTPDSGGSDGIWRLRRQKQERTRHKRRLRAAACGHTITWHLSHFVALDSSPFSTTDHLLSHSLLDSGHCLDGIC